MKRKAITMIGIAAVVGAISIFAADIWLKRRVSSPDAQMVEHSAGGPQVNFGTIVVAKVPLRFGMELSADQLGEIPWAEDKLPQGAFARIGELMEEGSRVVLSPIEQNEPVLLAKLSGPGGRATLSNLLQPGMRAVTIKVDEIAGVGGFITPGDRVDIVLTRDVGDAGELASGAAAMSGTTIASEIVLEGVKVLSVDQAADERSTGPKVASSVTVEVTADGARRITLARSVGVLSLSLRSAAGPLGPEDAEETDAPVPDPVDAQPTASVTPPEGELQGVGLAGAAAGLFAADADKPRFTTVIVTRGTVPESYEVLSPQE